MSIARWEHSVKVVGEERWSWMLFQENQKFFLTVLCGGVAMYTLDFELSAAEAAVIESQGPTGASVIAKQVNSNPSLFSVRHIKGFEEVAGVSEAAKAWRLAHPAP